MSDMNTTPDYKLMKLRELREVAKSRGIKYIVGMRKGKLIEVIEKNDLDPSYTIDLDTKKEWYGYCSRWRSKNREAYLKAQKRYNDKRSKWLNNPFLLLRRVTNVGGWVPMVYRSRPSRCWWVGTHGISMYVCFSVMVVLQTMTLITLQHGLRFIKPS
ncbi:uncharacterized protein LOC130662827 [Hydractinia symbiolongicarpus]|uniref:uncharacterized protein LOC130662827 n=1 Tax=Hydractinia symbiolongicarpus TaxID=13093 RepID=UPI00254CDEC5|nr:uncharacterized protein LOC130662827 [Hydractinia symbiolongicarpus]